MHYVIMGCGRVGSSLAKSLDNLDHSVSIIDVDVDAFRRLGPDFRGRMIKGVGFDRDVLRRAEIHRADGFAAVSSGDNSNILAARVVREVFGVTNVIARIYDQGRAEVYERLGIPTVATVRWAAGQVLQRLVPDTATVVWRDPTGLVGLVQLDYHNDWVGTPLGGIARAINAPIPILLRLGRGVVAERHLLLQDGDTIYAAMTISDHEQAQRILSAPPRPE